MGLLMVLLAIVAVSALSGLWLAKWWRQDRIERLRDRARLQVIEAQMTGLRAALRIQAAEHRTRQRMQAEARTVEPVWYETHDEASDGWRS